ncbi:MAG: hypothetical protein JWP12_374 [Bacteroidetes bacterium]|nr:hypothetical protein [Bacteroidota bacterium]
MRYLIIVFICSVFQYASAQKVPRAFKNESDSIPQFQFGKIEYDSLLYWNKKMPKDALLVDGLTADVDLTFDIDTSGKIENIVASDYSLRVSKEFIENNPASILKRLNDELTLEAKRLLLLTDGLWEPAKLNNQKIVKRIYTTIDLSAYDERLNGSQEFLDSLHKNLVYFHLATTDVTDNAYKQRNLFKAAVRKMKEKKTKLAIVYFLQAIDFNKNDINSYYNLGICYYRTHDVQNACKCWNTGKMLGDKDVEELLKKYCK